MAKLSFFDCNVQIGRRSTPRPEHILDAPGILGEMDRAGIERALVTHAFAVEWDPAEGNLALMEELRPHTRLHPCFVGLPPATCEVAPAEEFAARVREARGAVRLYPQQHQYVLDDVSCGPLLDVLGEARVPVLIDIGQTGWSELSELLARYPATNFVLLAVYYRVDRYLYPLLERFDNLLVESGTYGVHRGIEAVCNRFGAERLVFGTDLPVHEVGGPIAMVSYAGITDDEKQLIAGRNLARLLGEAS